jgi:transcriptional regulator with XRE-family HTH domain
VNHTHEEITAMKKPTRVVLTRQELELKIGKVIRELRLKKNLSPKQAASSCGCTLEDWKRWEREGFRDVHVLLKLSAFFDGSFSSITKLLEQKIPFHALSKIWTKKGYFSARIDRNMNLQEIESYLKNEDRIWVKEKLQALAWLAQGMKVKEVKKRLGRDAGLIQHWFWQYNKTGIGWVLKSNKVAPPREPSEVWKV